MISREQPGDHTEDGATPSPGAIDPGVLEAENIVCGAWEQILLERRDHMESALEAAFVCCDTAYQYLAAAQRAGDPKTISSAHAALEKSLDLARKSSIACNRIRQASLAELNFLAREVDEYTAATGATRPDQDGPMDDALDSDLPEQDDRAGQAHDISAVERLVRLGRRWLAQLILRAP